VHLNGAAYKLSRRKPETPGSRIRLWQLRNPNGIRYVVAFGKGVAVCDCPDSRHRPETQCKHLGALKALGLVPRSCSVPAVPPSKGGA
jgi:hypothetical protein